MKKLKLTTEQRAALLRDGEAFVSDYITSTDYVIVSLNFHDKAQRALQDQEDRKSIQRGIADMEAGRVHSSQDVDRRIRTKLGIT